MPTSSDVIYTTIHNAMEQYFEDLEGETPCEIYSMVLNKVEKPLFEVVLKHTEGNQTKAAQLLGINRNTLRKKLKLHNLDLL